MIYLIGGVPRSGKTTVRRKLLKEHRISAIRTDDLIDVLQNSAPSLGISFCTPSTERKSKLFPIIDALANQMIKNFEDFTIEGDGFDLEQLKKYKGNKDVKVFFIGMKSINHKLS